MSRGESGIFWFSFIFSLKSSNLGHSATAPPWQLVSLPKLDVVEGTTPQCSDLNSGRAVDLWQVRDGRALRRHELELLHEADEEEEELLLGQGLPEAEPLSDQERDEPLVRDEGVRPGVVEPVRVEHVRIFPVGGVVVDVEHAGEDLAILVGKVKL